MECWCRFGSGVNDAYQHTDEVDMVIGMLRSIEEAHKRYRLATALYHGQLMEV